MCVDCLRGSAGEDVKVVIDAIAYILCIEEAYQLAE